MGVPIFGDISSASQADMMESFVSTAGALVAVTVCWCITHSVRPSVPLFAQKPVKLYNPNPTHMQIGKAAFLLKSSLKSECKQCRQ